MDEPNEQLSGLQNFFMNTENIEPVDVSMAVALFENLSSSVAGNATVSKKINEPQQCTHAYIHTHNSLTCPCSSHTFIPHLQIAF